MNALLRAKLYKSASSNPDSLRLIGNGLDAIIQRTRRRPPSWFDRLFSIGAEDMPPREVKPEIRLVRYLRARLAQPAGKFDSLRQEFGAHFSAAWREGKFPKFHKHLLLIQGGKRR